MGNVDFIKEILLAVKAEFIRFRFLATGIFAVIFLSVLMVGASWPTFYTSKAQLVADDSNIIQPLLEGRAEITEVDRSEEARQRIYSRDLLETVARRLGYIDDTSQQAQIDNAIIAVRRGISLEGKGRRSPYFSISYSHPNPDITFETANVLVEEFIELHESYKRQEGEYAFDFINKQVEIYRGRLEEAEAALKEFKTNSPDYTESAVQARIQDLNTQIQELALTIQELESKIVSTKKQLGAEGEMLAAQSKVHSLRQQRSVLQAELNSLRRQYQESYPDVISLKRQIFEIDQQISAAGGDKMINYSVFGGLDESSSPELLFEELRKQVSIAEVDLEARRKRMNSLKELLKTEYEKADLVTETQAEFSDLTRDYEVTREVYEEMLSRKENAELSMAITREGQGLNYKVVDAPVFPLKPSGLTFFEFLLAAPILALGAPLGLIIMLVLVDPRIRVPTNLVNCLEEYSGSISVVGVSPHFYTKLNDRVLRKDFLIVATVFTLLAVVYIYFAVLGMAHEA